MNKHYFSVQCKTLGIFKQFNTKSDAKKFYKYMSKLHYPLKFNIYKHERLTDD